MCLLGQCVSYSLLMQGATCCLRSFSFLLDLDSVYSLFALRQPFGITGLPQVVTIVRQMMIWFMVNG